MTGLVQNIFHLAFPIFNFSLGHARPRVCSVAVNQTTDELRVESMTNEKWKMIYGKCS